MADSTSKTTGHTTRGLNQDRARVAGGQEHEVAYEARKTGTTPEQVKSAIGSAGNSRQAVERELAKGAGKDAGTGSGKDAGKDTGKGGR